MVRERHLVELTTALPRPRDHWRRLRFVVDQSRAFLDAGGAGLGEFVRWAREQAERGADAVESAVPEPDDDAVRILTVHASKGLEFPMVVLTGINADDLVRGQVSWTRCGPEVQPRKGFCTAGWESARQRDKVLEAAESVRLLYVALTRAEDHLVVSLHHKATKAAPRNHAARLHGLLPDLLAAGAVHEPERPTHDAEGLESASRPRVEFTEHEAFLEERAALLVQLDARLPVTPSGLAAALEPQEPLDPLEEAEPALAPAEVVPAPRRVSGGAALGTVVHRALELVDLTSPDIEAAVAVAVREAGTPQFRAQALQRLHIALASPLLQEAAGLQHWKEVPIVAEVQGRLVEGVVDLVVQRPQGLVVVDYKTDAVADAAALQAKTDHYAPQLRAYVAAVRAATSWRVLDALLLFVGSDQAVARPVPSALT